MTKAVWYTRCPVPTAFSIAIRTGRIQAALAGLGASAHSLLESKDPAVRQSHFDQTLSAFFRQGGNTPPIFSRARGKDVRVIGLSDNPSLRVILVRPDSDITTLADLRGKRISIPVRRNDPTDFWRTTVLRGFVDVLGSAGIDLAETLETQILIDRSYVSGSRSSGGADDSLWDGSFMLGHQREEALALIRGEVDAIYSQGSIGTIVQAFTGARAIFASHDTDAWVNNDAPLPLTVTGELLDERPDIVDAWLEETIIASQWAAGNALEAKRIIAGETGLAEDLVDAAFTGTIHERLDLDLSEGRVAKLQSQHDHLLTHGFIDAPVDFGAFIDHGPLRRVSERLDAAPARLRASA
ncbi:ABC transporter substrate-binding protein [Arsenicitalea aurantiaca]|uniref:ABC transporter substrate-binding protein n=1 Tax=Arsenicitalea aurantiaca TaxID=1783274 RepID=A0A433X2I7_9HYPH|nr:ABC transporter substrate-binding protein [Arsenicitalea aurantiaca]RUT28298.1 ABC transporter substrate-binding protein [Arsenicitalea aurantiaca]